MVLELEASRKLLKMPMTLNELEIAVKYTHRDVHKERLADISLLYWKLPSGADLDYRMRHFPNKNHFLSSFSSHPHY